MISLFLSPEQVSELDAVVHTKDGDKHYLKRLQSVPLKAVFTTLMGTIVIIQRRHTLNVKIRFSHAFVNLWLVNSQIGFLGYSL